MNLYGVNGVKNLIENPSEYMNMAKAVNPYGDGQTGKRIVNIVKSF